MRSMNGGDEELVVLVDAAGREIGTAAKRTVHGPNTPLHLGFSVFLFNSRSETLLQKRSDSKLTWPGVWSNSVCGHPGPGEAPIDAASRRLSFELGIEGVDLKLALPDFRYRAELNGIVENEICPVFIGYTDQEPRPNALEVSECRWIEWSELMRRIDDPTFELSPWAIEEARGMARTGMKDEGRWNAFSGNNSDRVGDADAGADGYE